MSVDDGKLISVETLLYSIVIEQVREHPTSDVAVKIYRKFITLNGFDSKRELRIS